MEHFFKDLINQFDLPKNVVPKECFLKIKLFYPDPGSTEQVLFQKYFLRFGKDKIFFSGGKKKWAEGPFGNIYLTMGNERLFNYLKMNTIKNRF